MRPILNIRAHKSVSLGALKERRSRLLGLCKSLRVKGAILLSPEGIGIRVAGEAARVETLLDELRRWPGLENLRPSVSGSERLPFRGLSVRIKRQIAAADVPDMPGDWTQCPKCLMPLNAEDRQHAYHQQGGACRYCAEIPAAKMACIIERRHARLDRLIEPLPGSQPRDHYRPISIPGECDGWGLLDALGRIVPHIPAQDWQARCDQGFMFDERGEPVASDRPVRAGERYFHRFPGLVEPDVNMRLRILYEDEALLVLNKPAPLPMHAGGRFHRNTLKYALDTLYAPQKLRPAHRLDANTTGALVISRTQFVAGMIQPQFARGEVDKVYLTRVQGHPRLDSFRCDAPISARAGQAGSRSVDPQGLPSRTDFRVRARWPDGTSLLEARPRTGRTNQIRVHLWHLGFPVCGDASYLTGGALGDTQTLPIDAPPLCLHAWQISFHHPLRRKTVTFSAPAPEWAERAADAVAVL